MQLQNLNAAVQILDLYLAETTQKGLKTHHNILFNNMPGVISICTTEITEWDTWLCYRNDSKTCALVLYRPLEFGSLSREFCSTWPNARELYKDQGGMIFKNLL